jgi:tetratricopeptide (TPR) repeat protein
MRIGSSTAMLVRSIVLMGTLLTIDDLFWGQVPNLQMLIQDGRQALQADDFPRAAHDFGQAMQLAPDNLEVNRGLLLSDLQIGRLDEAARVGETAVEKWPKDAQLQHWLGLVYFKTGKNAEALTWLKGSERLSPTEPDVPFDTALVLLSDVNYPDAANELEKSIKLDPKSALAHVLLGRAYQNTNRTVQAVQQFQTALRLDPKVSLGHYNLGFAYASLGRNQGAIAEYEKELRRSLKNPSVLYQLGHCELEMGDWQRAIDHLKQAAELDPTNPGVPYDLGKVFLLQGDAEHAVLFLRRAIELKPSSPSPHYQLARALEKSGKKDEAGQELATFAALKKAQPATGGMAAGPLN